MPNDFSCLIFALLHKNVYLRNIFTLGSEYNVVRLAVEKAQEYFNNRNNIDNT